MRKRIATLEIYVDDKVGNSAMSHEDGTSEYELTLGTRPDYANRKHLQSIMAHELGHFIANVTNDPTHKSEFVQYKNMTDDPRLVIPGERLAWKLANEMIPGQIDPDTMEESLGSYEQAGKEWDEMDREREVASEQWAGWV